MQSKTISKEIDHDSEEKNGFKLNKIKGKKLQIKEVISNLEEDVQLFIF